MKWAGGSGKDTIMVPTKSPDEMVSLIIALLCDVQKLHCEVLTPHACNLTIKKLVNRYKQEGRGFLTKSLPRLGKMLDQCLAGVRTFDSVEAAFEPLPYSKLPKFLGELFVCVFSSDGRVLPVPDAQCVKSLRQTLYLFYKYELPNDQALEQNVIDKFVRTEDDVRQYSCMFDVMSNMLQCDRRAFYQLDAGISPWVIRRAKRLLWELFRGFDPYDITPRHGPGAVAGRERFGHKYVFDAVSPRITSIYAPDEFFYSCMSHVCDSLDGNDLPIGLAEHFARVCLVPKDSRGPRLISCEPKAFQWMQQGLGRAIVRHVERHPLTRYCVHFTDQTCNRVAALYGSYSRKYATLDLNEASDRVSIGLVRLLFPEPILSALLACRSLATILPGGRILRLEKFAPMGSALCFPVLALTIWAILAASVDDTDLDGWAKNGPEPRILVYGDDVIVKTAQAANAMKALESFGLKINRDKSCFGGFFRESCGMDAYNGVDVTPVKLHTVWVNSHCPSAYASFVAYANEFWKRQYFGTYELITQMLGDLYGFLPSASMNLSCPSLPYVPDKYRVTKSRWNKRLQRREFLVWGLRSQRIVSEHGGWVKLFRFLTEWKGTDCLASDSLNDPHRRGVRERIDRDFSFRYVPWSASQYTERGLTSLVRKWMAPAYSEPVDDGELLSIEDSFDRISDKEMWDKFEGSLLMDWSLTSASL